MMTNNDWSTLRILFPYVSFESKITNDDQIKNIVCKTAYRDMMPRTLKGIGKAKNENGDLYKDLMLDYVCERIISYLKGSAPESFEEYTTWHRETCEEMVSIFHSSGLNFTHGKAQKLINITFKHLLLFQEAKEEYFIYCHTPIDNNVLRICREKANIDCIKDNWSGINDYGYYLELQNKISEFLNSDNNKEYRLENNVPATNLIFDFYAWIEGGGKDNLKEHWSYKAKEYEFYSNNKELINTILEKL